jgi:molecular chaperone GrpE
MLKSFNKDKSEFIVDEMPCSVDVHEKEPHFQKGLSKDNLVDEDLATILAKLLKDTKKETQTVYRIQHQKATDIEELLVSLLPVLDSFENLLSLAEQFAEEEVVQNWMKSMEAIYKKLKIVLSKQGLQSVESLGTLVDFTVHEVVEYRNIPDGITNLIIEEKQKGYRYKGKIIREARVVVSNAEGG